MGRAACSNLGARHRMEREPCKMRGYTGFSMDMSPIRVKKDENLRPAGYWQGRLRESMTKYDRYPIDRMSSQPVDFVTAAIGPRPG